MKLLVGFLLVVVLGIATLLLISWRRGSQRAGCILNIRNAQNAVRSFQGISNLNIGDPIDWETLFLGPKAFMKEPVCPGGGTYTFTRFHPEIGVLACTCSLAGTQGHEPLDHKNW